LTEAATLAPASRKQDSCRRRRRAVGLSASVPVLVPLPAPLLRLPSLRLSSAASRRRVTAGVRAARAAPAARRPCAASVLVLLLERRGLLPERSDVSRGVGQGSAATMMTNARILPVVAGLLMTACATIPTGPSVMVLPGNGKNFDQFQTDDAVCRQWAAQQTGTTTKQVAHESTVSGAVIG